MGLLDCDCSVDLFCSCTITVCALLLLYVLDDMWWMYVLRSTLFELCSISVTVDYET